MILQDTTERYTRVPFGLHRVPDDVVMARIDQDLDLHYGENWWASIAFSGGKVASLGAHNYGLIPNEMNKARIMELAIRLNRDLHHDGHWVLGFDFTEDMIFALWRDKDGDAQFDASLMPLKGSDSDSSIDGQIDILEQAYQVWREWTFKDLEQKEGRDTFKRALGEKSKAVH